jgi:hypothetical protein
VFFAFNLRRLSHLGIDFQNELDFVLMIMKPFLATIDVFEFGHFQVKSFSRQNPEANFPAMKFTNIKHVGLFNATCVMLECSTTHLCCA